MLSSKFFTKHSMTDIHLVSMTDIHLVSMTNHDENQMSKKFSDAFFI